MDLRSVVLERLVLHADENQGILTSDPHQIDRVKTASRNEGCSCNLLDIQSLDKIRRTDSRSGLKVTALLS